MNSTNTLEVAARTKLDRAEVSYRDLLTSYESRMHALPETASVEDVDSLTAEFRSRLDAAEAQVTSARQQLETAEALTRGRAATSHLIPAADVRVSEARTYDFRNPTGPSYFADLFAATRTGSPEAIQRLQRNNAEVAEARGESRAVLTSTDFYPPQFMSDLYVSTQRPRLVYGGLVKQLPLPPMGETVTVPKYTAPTDAANFQAGDNAAIQTSVGTTSQLTAPIALAAGYADVSRQAVERAAPGLDEVIFSDISRDIAHKIEVGCLNGSGTNAPLGILQDSGVPAVTVSAQTAVQVLLKVADLLQRVEVAVGEPADFILMHSRRFSWLASLVDSQNRPLIVPEGQGPFNSFGTITKQGEVDGFSLTPDVRPMGYMLGLPIYTSSSIPTTNGAGTNEDWMVVGVRDLAVRWSDPQGIRTFSFEGVASSTASIRCQALTYSSYITRYPTAFGTVRGLSTPSF